MRRMLAIGVTAAAFAAGGGSADAATFYVDDSSPSTPTPCTSPPPADACQTIGAAITQARGIGFPGGDTIQVAAGSYTGETSGVKLNNAADAGDTIDGAGSGTDAGATVIQLPANQDLEVHENDVTLRDVTIEPTSNFQPVYIGNFTASGPSGVIFDDVQVQLDSTTSAWAVEVDRSTNTSLNHLTVDGGPGWDGTTAYALRNSQAANTVVNDSTLHSNGPAVLTRDSTLTLNRTFVLGTVDLDQPVISNLADLGIGSSSLTLDSSLVALGSVGVKVDATAMNSTANATIRSSTIDPDLPKNATAPGVTTTANLSGSSTTVGIDSSIVVGGVTSGAANGGTGTVTCTNTDVSNTLQAAPAAISCSTAAGNPGANSTTAPALLFEPGGFLGLGWHLLPSSPAIDTGAPGPLAGGQSTTDLDGNPRLLDGNADCVERRDKGAYEVTGQAGCPQPSPTSTPAPTTQAPLQQPAKKKCKKNRKHRAAAAKSKCKRGKKRA
jgi:hypothetical protein